MIFHHIRNSMTLIFFLVIYSACSNASDTLCHKDEDIYFSCTLEGTKKIVSVCASKNSSPALGYVQYRYGTQRSIELQFPSSKLPPKDKFVFVNVFDGSISGSHLRFQRDDYTYVITTTVAAGALYIVRNKKVVFYRVCGEGKNNTFPDGIDHSILVSPMSEVDDH